MSKVYAHVAADGSYLYIGLTSNLHKRTAEHRTGSAWWPNVTYVRELADLPYDDARRLEAHLIAEHDPPHNYIHTAAWRAARSPRALDPAPRCDPAWCKHAKADQEKDKPHPLTGLITPRSIARQRSKA